jgi:hypothetical protein
VTSGAAEWPGELVALETDPDAAAPSWAEHIQGVSFAPGCWFVSQPDTLWRFALDADGTDGTDAPDVTTGIPEPGIDHLGDCDVHEGLLHVAMEGTTPARIGVFDLDLRYRSSAAVPPQGASCPWCAVNPQDGLLYSSPFDTDHLCAYALDHATDGFELRHVRDVPLLTDDGRPLMLERVQGGAFTRSGQLYLASDRTTGGIHGIDVPTGRRMVHQPIPFDPDGPDNEVIEGLAVTDQLTTVVPWLPGLLHVLVLAIADDGPDRIWLRHYGPTPGP